MPKKCLTCFAVFAMVLAPSARGQTPDHPAEEIVLVGIIGPESETVTLEASCFSRLFRFSIVNERAGPARLANAVLDGREPSRDSVEALGRFLATVRTVRFESTNCISDSEIGIGLSGLLISPERGAPDDVLRLFRVRFPAPASATK